MNPAEVLRRMSQATCELQETCEGLNSEFWTNALMHWDEAMTMIGKLRPAMETLRKTRGRGRRREADKDTWYGYECYGPCASNSSGVVLDVRLPGRGRMAVQVSCPLCNEIMEFKGEWPADKNGYGSRGDSVGGAPRARGPSAEHRCFKCMTPASMSEDRQDCPSHALNGSFCSFDCQCFLCDGCKGLGADPCNKIKPAIVLRVDAMNGSDLRVVFNDMKNLATTLKIPVESDVNGRHVVVMPGDDPRKIAEEYEAKK